jgi:ketosteroid isomerase-like protein
MGAAQRFYDAFVLGDWHTMGMLYAPQATFSDPVFPHLNAAQARAMWQMLLSSAEDFSVAANVQETDTHASVIWIARYSFGPTGRPVVNRVHTEMELGAGRILRQVDRFSFWRWSRQALGTPGLLLGWTPLLRARVRAKAAGGLARFMQSHGVPATSAL